MRFELVVDENVLEELRKLVEGQQASQAPVQGQEERYKRTKKDEEEIPYYQRRGLRLEEVYDGREFWVRRLSKYLLGDGVWGRAFPDLGLIEILETLRGPDFDRVEGHEVFHVRNPAASEYETRVWTNTVVFSPNPYVSAA